MTAPNESVSTRIKRLGEQCFGSGWRPDVRVRAPGRIEIIGNHVAYNGGPVLAAAIDREIRLAARSTAHGELRIVFADVPDPELNSLRLDDLADWQISGSEPESIDFVRGVIASLTARDLPVRSGLDAVVAGDLPAGLGISSSAALCVGLTLLLAQDRPADGDLVLIAQEAEHRAGSPCGAMDQSASVAGGLIEFSGADNSVSSITSDLECHAFVVINSGVERSLASSSYPERVNESHAALAILNASFEPPLKRLAQIDLQDLRRAKAVLTASAEPALAARVRHVVTECDRVRQASAAIADSDWTEVGRLMSLSGASSARDYAISHPDVEEIVRICREADGVLGARMMGGGEGGAALALIQREALHMLSERLDAAYFGPRELVDLEPRIVPCVFASGAGFVEGER